MKTLAEKLEKWVLDPGSGCWVWYGAMFRAGYGNVRHDGRNMGAHRAMYELQVGPIPAGYDIDHLCRNPSCIRPAHLEPVTRKENLHRGDVPWGKFWADKTHCPKGHPYAGENLRTNGRRRTCKECGRASYRERYHAGLIKGRSPSTRRRIMPSTTQEAIAAARERMRKQEELIRELEAREAAKAVVVEAFTRGDTLPKIMVDFGLSENAVRKILTDAGKLRVVKRKLDIGDEVILVAALRTGEKFDAVAERLGFAKSVVRAVAKKHGVRQTRAYTQKRSAAEIETLRDLERQLKAQFGAGFAGLGEALRKANAAEAAERAKTQPADEGQVSVTFRPSAPVGEPLSEAERASEPVHPVSEGVDVNGESEPQAVPEPDLSTW